MAIVRLCRMTVVLSFLFSSLDVPISAQLGSLDAAVKSAGDNVSSVVPPNAFTLAAGDPATSPADQLVLTNMRTIDKAENLAAPVFSADGSRLFYGRSSGGKHMVVIRDAKSGKVLSSLETNGRVAGLALSPDEQRLLICTANLPSDIGIIYEFKTARSIELPVSFGGCRSKDEQPVSWVDESTVIFGGWTMNLDDLQRRREPDRQYPARNGPSYSTHPNAFYSPQAGGEDGLWVCDRQSDYCHLLLATTEPWLTTKDLTQVVLLDFCMGCSPSFTLHALTLATRVRPIREFSLVVDHGNLGSPSFAHPETLRHCRASKPPLFGRVTGPTINPLNGRVIGGDGSDKGTVSLVRTGDPVTQRAVLIREMAPVSAGDVVDKVWSPGECSVLGTQQLVLPLRPALNSPGPPPGIP